MDSTCADDLAKWHVFTYLEQSLIIVGSTYLWPTK